jgi:porphobilinogen synthase
MFPDIRMQRLRRTQMLRDMVAETTLSRNDLIAPIFVNESLSDAKPIEALPGVSQQSMSTLLHEVAEVEAAGIPAVILFGIPAEKDPLGSSAYDPEGIIQRAARLIKSEHPDLIVIGDCCLCEYTSHGHCGVTADNTLNNDATLGLLQKIAVTYADSGVDIIAPSGMMDGMVAAIRSGLDDSGHELIPIMSYAVKFASGFYDPFREAAGSASEFKGDRKHHQLPFTQRREALREAELDIAEGADFLMVKPVLTYMDIVRDVREMSDLPIAVYNVSGEYAMFKAAAAAGVIDEHKAFFEAFTAMKRAGADLIITYYAKQMAEALRS